MTTKNPSSANRTAMPDATLPEGCDSPFDLLRAAKRAGRYFGLGPQDLTLLELYICCTRREDWAEGRRPLCTRPVIRTAAALGVSPRSVNTAERRLERLGLIRRATRADGMRGGWDREEGGALYGIDLAPLVAAYPALLACAEAARARAERVTRLRAAISRSLGAARRLAEGCGAAVSDSIAALLALLPARTPQSRDPEALEAVLARVERVAEALRALPGAAGEPVDNSVVTRISSGASEEIGPLLYTTDPSPESTGKALPPTPARRWGRDRAGNGSARADGAAHGLRYLKDRDIGRAMPDSWHEAAGTLPGQFLWHRFVMAAQTRLRPLGVPEALWREAVAVMGQEAAALSLMILDVNRRRPGTPVRNLPGALRGMARRAEEGGLRLHASVYGILARRGQVAA